MDIEVYYILQLIPQNVKVGISNVCDIESGVKTIRAWDEEQDCLISEYANDQEKLGSILHSIVKNISAVGKDVIILYIADLTLQI